MVKIRYLTKEGDTQKTMCLTEAKQTIANELEKNNMVFDEDEKRIVTNATLGQIRAEGNYAVFPKIAGG